MNSYLRNASVSFEILKENNLYTFIVPVGVTYDEAQVSLEEFKEQLLKMKEVALQKEKEEKEAKEAKEKDSVE